MKPSTRRSRARLAVATLASLAALPAHATLVSESSFFGPNSITHDTESGLRWLDLPISTGLSYGAVLGQLESGGVFAGYRLATGGEVSELFGNAGMDLGEVGDFVPENYAPIVALAGLLGGPLSDNGNCGAGCDFFFTQGWIDNGNPPSALLSLANLAWFDNSALLSDDYPQAPIGRFSFPTTFESASAVRGAWLVQAPEPRAAAPGLAAALALAALDRIRRLRARPSLAA